MNWPRWLPWIHEHRELTLERAEAERRADEVEHHLAAPLRAMRTYDYLTGAVAAEIRRKAAEGAEL